jgi:hypothetical protein
MDCVEQHEAEHLADAGHGLQQLQGVGVMVPGGCDDGACDVAQPLVVGGDERQINGHTLVDGWSGTALGPPLAVGFGGALFAKGRQVIRAVGILHVREELGPFVCQRHAAPQQVTGGAHVGGRDRGLREHAAPEQDGHLWRIALVVFGLAAMDSLHREGMTEDERDTCVGTEVGEPVPGEHTRDRHDNPLSIRGHGVQKGFRSSFPIAMHQNLAALVEEADVHGAGMHIDAAVKWVLGGVASPEVASACE